ncbi:hypothetical protein M2168_004020 [Streptomyces sp. CZ24]|nr:hypothetical protein [Streptomyces sp. CZ24]
MRGGPHPPRRVPVHRHLRPPRPGQLERPLHRLHRHGVPARQQIGLPDEHPRAGGVERVERLTGARPGRPRGTRGRTRGFRPGGTRAGRLRASRFRRGLGLPDHLPPGLVLALPGRRPRLGWPLPDGLSGRSGAVGRGGEEGGVRLQGAAARGGAPGLPGVDGRAGDAHPRGQRRLAERGRLAESPAFRGGRERRGGTVRHVAFSTAGAGTARTGRGHGQRGHTPPVRTEKYITVSSATPPDFACCAHPLRGIGSMTGVTRMTDDSLSPAARLRALADRLRDRSRRPWRGVCSAARSPPV